MVLPAWHHTVTTVAIPAVRLTLDSGGSDAEAVQQVFAKMARCSSNFQLSQFVQQDLQAPLTSLIGGGRI